MESFESGNPVGKSRRRTIQPLLSGNRLPVLGALTLIALAFSAWSAVAFAQQTFLPPDLLSPLTSASPEKRNEVVATVNGEELTREMLFWYNMHWGMSGITSSEVFSLPPRDLKTLVEDAAVTSVAARRAQEPDSGVGREILDMSQSQRDEFLVMLLESREVAARVEKITPEEIRSFYEQNTEAFKTPFTFSIRHIFVSTYESVLTKPGDTLEALARDISGDSGKVDLILIDSNAKAPRAPDYSKGNRATLKPLEPGERLLVPISEEAKPERRKKIEAAMERLRAGDNFTSVAIALSENSSKGDILHHVEQAGKPVLPAIAENVTATPVGGYSPIFETKHGYNVILVEQKTLERVAPLEEAEAAIHNHLMARKRSKALDDYTKSLYALPDLKIEKDKIKDPGAPGDAPVVTLEGKTYPRSKFVPESLGETSKDMRDEDALSLVRTDADLRRDLKALQARRTGVDKTGEYRGRILGLTERTLRQSYLQAQRERIAAEEITPEEARKYFETYPQDFVMLPYYTFYLLALRVEDPDRPEVVRATMERAGQLIAPARTLDRFRAVIQEHGVEFPRMREKGLMENVAESEIQPDLLAALQSLKTGEMAAPIYEEPFVMTPWLVSRTAARAATYEEVRSRLPLLIRERKLRTFPESQIEELLEEANIVWR